MVARELRLNAIFGECVVLDAHDTRAIDKYVDLALGRGEDFFGSSTNTRKGVQIQIDERDAAGFQNPGEVLLGLRSVAGCKEQSGPGSR